MMSLGGCFDGRGTRGGGKATGVDGRGAGFSAGDLDVHVEGVG